MKLEEKYLYLMKFYQVNSIDELVAVMANHIEKLQERLRKSESTTDFALRFPRG